MKKVCNNCNGDLKEDGLLFDESKGCFIWKDDCAPPQELNPSAGKRLIRIEEEKFESKRLMRLEDDI